MATRFSTVLMQDVMDTLFARRVSGELFTAADEKALSSAMRRGGTRTASVRPAVVSVPVVKTQRVPEKSVPEKIMVPTPLEPMTPLVLSPAKPLVRLLWSDATRVAVSLGSVLLGAPVWVARSIAVKLASMVAALVATLVTGVTHTISAFASHKNRFVQGLQAGLRKQSIQAKRAKQKRRRLRLAATAGLPTPRVETPNEREIIPMAAIVSSPPESYALMALPTVQQRPDLQVFINEALPTTVPTAVAEVETSPDVFSPRPVVTPLVSDAAVRTLMAHHPQPESLDPNSETDRLLHHNRFLASSINNLAERYFSLQHQS